MERKVIKTSDGSTTIYIENWNEHYHSKHGAIQEAYHVFINSGFYPYLKNNKSEELSILEIGFGTGLNAFITYLEAENNGVQVKYDGVEAYPVKSEEIALLNYVEELKAEEKRAIFNKMHEIDWEDYKRVSKFFQLKKRKQFFSEITDVNLFDIVYFDAFGARVQPELWEEVIFEKMYKALKTNGILVTYAAKGSVRRAMQKVGFMVEKLPGPPGKREMLRAVKNC
ncbi:tRNA (5-methylaminomethyl-2-thiouridine)(34)-methyltransferase MnmD [Galbibacter pacificus]|uniref:tRNA (5-methylaminomethyl-2-thiouridine)(34)-methyltransferase MnmD n=1 Tax=Galbibacter pacificus TaxID=2996052 RepID=A0ABT6FPC5_9FLAO|nr:tRNA (5-methylaminomethyl-2-thiouridine)(34)-methyltransferase MnmD [Galbibacter pacificus]MDG3581468.1 tRNA (5-methylaminomethyl-2-thiouridine)(34)-methyltransferase MnmD [Galbibacter pacificus]MDG3584946.1 tRNA (5-methylaminomethyl-2-thiouridine)(34)-methyltransferase MnmD [Galbibacter pacificus]